MSTPQSENVFPDFTDGDVTIIVSSSHQYRLHSHVLRQHAGFFRTKFDETVTTKLTAQARRDGNTPYRFILVDIRPLPNWQDAYDDQKDHEEPKQKLVSCEVSPSGATMYIVPRVSNFDLSGDDQDKYWDWLFGCFYGISPAIDTATFSTTLQDCVELLGIADMVQADLCKEVDLALMRQDGTLWKSIANNPIPWAELGRRIKSPAIFREAVIHLIGKWKMLSGIERKRLPMDIARLCQRKWDELELAKRAIEIRIAGHYPGFLLRHHEDKPHRTAYSNDIYMWMVMSFFRQYISQSGTDRKNRLAKDGGYKWYKEIHEGGSAYLDHDSMRTFHSYFPMSIKAVGIVEQNMNVLKEDVKVFVRDLMVSRSHIDPASLPGETPWLTCAVIEEEDLPWKGAADADTPYDIDEEDYE